MSSDSRVLVTGGSGFVGSWVLKELLERGATPLVLDNRPAPERWRRVLGDAAARLNVSPVSLLDRDGLARLLDAERISHIIHLAALLTPECQSDPFRGCEINVLGSVAVFDAARLTGRVASIVYASSYAIYGPERPDVDQQPNRPPMFYGAYKQAFDGIADQYARHFGLASVALRPHVVYGPEREQGLTAGPSLACRAAARGESYTIGYRGVVGYDYVEDVARAFVASAFHPPRGHAGFEMPSVAATTEQFVDTLEAIEPSARGRIQVAGPFIPANTPPHPVSIAALLPDWTPTSLEEGIRRTIDFYRRPAH
jgi:nucleoside-diphosphate-sugar epimerase